MISEDIDYDALLNPLSTPFAAARFAALADQQPDRWLVRHASDAKRTTPAIALQRAQKQMPPDSLSRAASGGRSLTMTYFHTGPRTIIGAEAFHCPVRDGKEWDHLAMVVRRNLSPVPSLVISRSQRGHQPIHRVKSILDCAPTEAA